MLLKCESCIESSIFPTFDWLIFIPGPRANLSLKMRKKQYRMLRSPNSILRKRLLNLHINTTETRLLIYDKLASDQMLQ